MEVNDGGGSLSITNFGDGKGGGGNGTPRKTITEGTYEAEYRGFKLAMEQTRDWGEKKTCRLLFKIADGGEFDGSVTSYKKFMVKTNDGRWVVGGKTDLAEAIRTITGGTDDLTPQHVGKRFFIKVSNRKAKKPSEDGTFKVYDDVASFMAAPARAAAPKAAAPAAQPAQPVPAGVAAAAKPAAAAAPADTGTLDNLTELSDFEKF